MAAARAVAQTLEIPLYRYLGGVNACILPTPMLNVLNGGAHADSNVDFQEFMIMPVGAERFSDALRWAAETFHTLKGVLKKKGYNTAVGDEGGFAPSLKSNAEAIELILEAIEAAGYKPGEQIAIALDPASSEFYDKEKNKYVFKKSDKRELTSEEMVHFYDNWTRQYPIVSLEDGLAEDDWDGWKTPHRQARQPHPAGRRRPVRHQRQAPAARHRRGRGQLHPDQGQPDRHRSPRRSKPSSSAAATATPRSCRIAPAKREDTFIADLAVATGVGQIKTGSVSRTDRIAKYNQLLRIEEELGSGAAFLGLESINYNG